MIDPWTLSTTSHDRERENLLRRGNIFQIANGYMGYRGTLDEFGPEESVGITLAGIFDQVGDAWREPVNAPNGAFSRLYVDGVELSALGKPVRRHRQTVHFRNALFERETSFSVRGKTVRLHSARFLSADQPNLGAVRLTISSDRAATVTIRTGIDYNIWDLNGPHLHDLAAAPQGGALLVQGRTGENARVCVAETLNTGNGAADQIENIDRRILRTITVRLKPGRSQVLEKFFTVFTQKDPITKPIDAAATMLALEASTAGYDECLRRHNEQWNRKWSRCDVKIEGDEEAQHALRYSILQLLMAAPVEGSANSIPARALSGQVYKGAVFWDTEMFMFPFFLHTQPETAAELLRYRVRTLDGARRKAATEGPGFRGAFYAWESQDTGDEACTYFNIGDPVTGRELRTHFRDKQVHISGDIAIAMWEYFQTTGDDSVLLDGGAEVILECARFYFSYAFFKEEKHRYEMLDVVGPDEYHERVNNNAFTNLVARETFVIADRLVRHLRAKHPKALRALVGKLRIANELRRFQDAARHLYVPQPDRRTGIIEQFEGYHRLRQATPAELSALKSHPNEYPGAGQGLAVPTQVIKQADVVMMLYLFRQRFSERVKRANWEYYEPRTEHGSSLSASAYALVATEFGNLDVAYKYFLQTAKIDIEAKYKVYVGTIFTGGSHPAANGGAWMTAVLGFGGVADNGKRLTIRPRLYSKWSSLEFQLASRGGSFRVAINASTVSVTADAGNRRTQVVEIAGKSVRCAPGKSITVAYGKTSASARAA
ncbi:MAG TPA: glycosyl hydrolase family 65 protein [Opitutaceae bacterium]|jgi:kojibiose phosphorylase